MFLEQFLEFAGSFREEDRLSAGLQATRDMGMDWKYRVSTFLEAAGVKTSPS